MTGNFPNPAIRRPLFPPANPRPRLHKSFFRLHKSFFRLYKSKPVTIREKCRQQSITLKTGLQENQDFFRKYSRRNGTAKSTSPRSVSRIT